VLLTSRPLVWRACERQSSVRSIVGPNCFGLPPRSDRGDGRRRQQRFELLRVHASRDLTGAKRVRLESLSAARAATPRAAARAGRPPWCSGTSSLRRCGLPCPGLVLRGRRHRLPSFRRPPRADRPISCLCVPLISTSEDLVASADHLAATMQAIFLRSLRGVLPIRNHWKDSQRSGPRHARPVRAPLEQKGQVGSSFRCEASIR
jgi:hypothetical protein